MTGKDRQFNWFGAARGKIAEVGTVDPELFRMIIKLSKTLLKMEDPEMAKTLIVGVFHPGIEKWEKLQAEADGNFKFALQYMQTKEYDRAAEYFRKTRDIRDEIGEKKGAILAMAFVYESLSRMWFKNSLHPFSTATEQAKKALELFKELGNQEGIVRIEELIKEIEQKEQLEKSHEEAKSPGY